MKATNLGDFEELVLMTVCILTDESYAVKIKEDLEERMNKKVNISAVHTALYRMEDKGFLKSSLKGSSNIRGGRRKRYFSPTSAGTAALKQLQELRNSMYQNIPSFSNA